MRRRSEWLRLLTCLVFAQACVGSPDAGDTNTAADASADVSVTEERGRAPGSLRVLAYNIRHGEGMDSVINLKRVAELINDLEPDIVTLQEVDSAVERSLGVYQAGVLGELTGMHAAFGAFFDYQGGRYGMAVLARDTMLSFENHRLPDGLEPRTALAVNLEIDGTEITVVGIHLYASAEERLAQAERLVQIFEHETAPVILAGDFNSEPDSEVITLLAQHWEIPDKGDDRLTFRSDKPDREIDYIMYRPAGHFEVASHWVIDEPLVSDHRPVVIDLRIR